MKAIYRKRVPAVACLVLALVFSSLGCTRFGASQDDSEFQVRYTTSGSAVLNGKTLPVEKLSRALRRAGAGKQSRILIEMPENATPMDLRRISRALARGGFHKFIFKQPRRAEVSLEEP